MRTHPRHGFDYSPVISNNSSSTIQIAGLPPGLMTVTGDQRLLREINRMALVRAIQRSLGISRAKLAKETGLTKSTVSLLAQDLIDEGWLFANVARATGDLGRRPTPLHLNGDRLAMIGADVGSESINLVTVSLTGAVLDAASAPLANTRPVEVIGSLARAVAALVSRSGDERRRLLGIGVGVPGAVLDRQGVVELAPNLPWRDVPLRTELTAALSRLGVRGVPVQVQNDYDAAVLGEYEFGAEVLPDPLIYLGLGVGVGVGAGIIVRDRLFLDAEGYAGEVGHSILQPDGPLCSCGRHGCAEALIGLRAISSAISGDT